MKHLSEHSLGVEKFMLQVVVSYFKQSWALVLFQCIWRSSVTFTTSVIDLFFLYSEVARVMYSLASKKSPSYDFKCNCSFLAS